MCVEASFLTLLVKSMLFSFLCQSTSASFTLLLNSVHFSGMIGTCNVMSNACELIKLVSDLESITKKKNTWSYTNSMVIHYRQLKIELSRT